MLRSRSSFPLVVALCWWIAALSGGPSVVTNGFLEIRVTPSRQTLGTTTPFRRQPLPRLFLAGFGSSGTSSTSSSKEKKLKPKQQWDRYNALRQENKFRVAVRVANIESNAATNEETSTAEQSGVGEWLEVGRVKSKDNAMTELAVAQQRGLIVDHARRLFPLQISPKDRIEWAYWCDDKEDWVLVDPKQSLDLPDQWDKQIGFEGRPDPATGFYCLYNEGRLVTDENEVDAPSKRKVK